MLKNNAKKLFFIALLPFMLSSCGGEDQSSQTEKYIADVKAQTKPNATKKPDDVDISKLEKLLNAPNNPTDVLKTRNPLAVAAVPITESPTKENNAKTALKLMGIFSMGPTGTEKRWAIISFDDKIYKVTAGEKVGENVISQVNEKSVTVKTSQNGEEASYTLNLQEQKK